MPDTPTTPTLTARPLAVLGMVAIAAGFFAIGLAWYHAGNTSQVWIQNQELISGGVGGLAVVVLGLGLLIHDQIARWRAEEMQRWDQLITVMEAAKQTPPTRVKRRTAA